MHPDPTSLYYTFSTIAQVLASMIALSGVFLVFKIQDMKNILLNTAREYIEQSIQTDVTTKRTFKSNINKAAIKLIMRQMRSINKLHLGTGFENVYTRLSEVSGFYESLYFHRWVLISLCRSSMKFGIATIFFCIIVLPCITYIPKNLLWFSASIAIFGSIVSIAKMYRTISLALKDHDTILQEVRGSMKFQNLLKEIDEILSNEQ